ncbi:MAG: hypothetical protein ACI8TS_002366, partial [Flavobacteriales bacterium]
DHITLTKINIDKVEAINANSTFAKGEFCDTTRRLRNTRIGIGYAIATTNGIDFSRANCIWVNKRRVDAIILAETEGANC